MSVNVSNKILNNRLMTFTHLTQELKKAIPSQQKMLEDRLNRKQRRNYFN